VLSFNTLPQEARELYVWMANVGKMAELSERNRLHLEKPSNELMASSTYGSVRIRPHIFQYDYRDGFGELGWSVELNHRLIIAYAYSFEVAVYIGKAFANVACRYPGLQPADWSAALSVGP
jgi:hypothetical protein